MITNLECLPGYIAIAKNLEQDVVIEAYCPFCAFQNDDVMCDKAKCTPCDRTDELNVFFLKVSEVCECQ